MALFVGRPQVLLYVARSRSAGLAAPGILRCASATVSSTASATSQSHPIPHGTTNHAAIRHDWSRDEVRNIYKQPLLELVFQAANIHRVHFDPREVQQSTLLSVKTGGCAENCGYCSQSQKFKTAVKPTPMLKVDEVLETARKAKAAGSTRFCMGAAWRGVGKKRAFEDVLAMVRGISGMGMETCTTLGLLTAEQAARLKEAGLTAYNHNLDTSPEHYPNIVSTRTYADRLETLANVREAGISVCCGGILGIAETEEDRIGLLTTLATLPSHPESVPINALVPIEGTPIGNKQLAKKKKVEWYDMVRAIATARIIMPRSFVRLSAGRMSFSLEAQGFMFMAGANSIFTGDQLLTTPNPEFSQDAAMFELMGLRGKAPFTGVTAEFRPRWAPAEGEEHAAMEQTATEHAATEHGENISSLAASMPAVEQQAQPRAVVW